MIAGRGNIKIIMLKFMMPYQRRSRNWNLIAMTVHECSHGQRETFAK